MYIYKSDYESNATGVLMFLSYLNNHFIGMIYIWWTICNTGKGTSKCQVFFVMLWWEGWKRWKSLEVFFMKYPSISIPGGGWIMLFPSDQKNIICFSIGHFYYGDLRMSGVKYEDYSWNNQSSVTINHLYE